MNDRPDIMVATTVGAVLGAIAGFLFFTDRGRALLGDLEPAIENMGHELNHFRQTMMKAVDVANDGWKLMNETLGDPARSTSRYADPHQTTPF